MILIKPTDKFVNSTLNRYEKQGGHLLNIKLQKLFVTFNDNLNLSETRIKVAALNTLYSTAIKNINPVVDKIVNVSTQITPKNNDDFIAFVDQISNVKWTNPKTQITYKRNNLSFASKYVHFLSSNQIPIYDSYIWLIIKGYLGQYGMSRMSFTNPKSYEQFYLTFSKFKTEFELEKFTNYELDKFLWQYGKSSIDSIQKELDLNLSKAKSELKRRIRSN